MDRYCYSGAAFTMAKSLPGLDMEWCKSIEREKLPKPDHTYVLDLPVEIAQTRAGFGSERYEQKEIQEQVVKPGKHKIHCLGALLDDSSWMQYK